MGRRQERREALRDALERLSGMGACELRALWQARRGVAPPRFATARVLRAALGWDQQAEALGGERPVDRRRWQAVERLRAAGASAADAAAGVPSAPVAVGTRLVRTWRGRTHEVLVTADGVEWRGQRYRSLSAVARAMTGTRRNGPAFFGLRERGGEGA